MDANYSNTLQQISQRLRSTEKSFMRSDWATLLHSLMTVKPYMSVLVSIAEKDPNPDDMQEDLYRFFCERLKQANAIKGLMPNEAAPAEIKTKVNTALTPVLEHLQKLEELYKPA